MRADSTPKPWLAASAETDTLSRMRLKAGVVISVPSSAGSSFRDWIVFRAKRGTSVSALPLKKGAEGRPGLLRFLFCRLLHRDRLTGVTHFEAREAAHRNVFAQLANLCGN